MVMQVTLFSAVISFLWRVGQGTWCAEMVQYSRYVLCSKGWNISSIGWNVYSKGWDGKFYDVSSQAFSFGKSDC